MAIKINSALTAKKLLPKIIRLFDLSAEKILSIEKTWQPSKGTPVFTVKGRYTSRGWTEWTQGFQFGSALLQFDATAEERFLDIGRSKTIERMATHVSHVGVHDHGFNNISTYGNLWRLMREGKIPHHERENDFYELALKVSGAVQAARWTQIANGKGYIYSFNGPHSQQGYSPFSTWTRGLAWAILGFAEQLEFFASARPVPLTPFSLSSPQGRRGLGRGGIVSRFTQMPKSKTRSSRRLPRSSQMK